MDRVMLQQGLSDFSAGIDKLVDTHGESSVLSALELIFPNLDLEGVDFGASSSILGEHKSDPRQALGEGPKGKKGLGMWLVSALGLGGLTTAGATTASALTKGLDQDVNIADQSIVLRVQNSRLEDMMNKTNRLLAKLVAQMSSGIEQLDVSLDDLIAAETGEDPVSVRGRQATMGAAPRPRGRAPTPGEKEEKD